ncbi:MAG: endopeptidase La [Anaerolineaceae bacterium]|nr:endopeptidase La [Anaerolineaceae bacterium]MDD4042152.1 endopeptidase La [Anaerolineaceae bacterium]MDD4578774.1 endopeptidase La [Anaerolineaceae bacterium]
MQEPRRFSDYEEEIPLDERRMYSTAMRVKNRTSTKKESHFTAPLIILYNEPLLPRSASRLYSDEDVSNSTLMFEALENNFTLVACYPRFENVTEPTLDNIWEIGLEVAFGVDMESDESDPYAEEIYMEARRRVRILKIHKRQELYLADVEVVDIPARRTNEVKSQMRSAISSLAHYASLPTPLDEKAVDIAERIDHVGNLADFIGINTLLSPYERIELLQETNDLARLKKAHAKLVAQIRMLELDIQVISGIHEDFDKNQRETVLREHINRLQMELNEGKSSDPDIQKLESQLEAARLPEEAYETAVKELNRLRSAPPLSPENGMISNYLHSLLDLPWSEATEDDLDVRKARAILDKNHYGLKKAKDRILEFLAVKSLRPKKNRLPILCFVGPPGTGKTSLGQSIAEAMKRKFVRMSLGGVHDEAEIRGHRRTYIGALPGRILQTMMKAKVVNPLFMLDEIDKLSADFHGDPSAALLEVLDPEQNFSFSDHYLEVPYDLSQVFFITTANTVASIPPALLDRMELIEFPGYIEEDKIIISRQFLIPGQMLENGLDEDPIEFTDDALRLIIASYTYEAGVRNLEREIGTVLRKIATKKSEGEEYPTLVTADLVCELLGPVEFFPMSAEAKDEIGVATALAWTENGGEIMPIEVLVVSGKGNLQITGQIGEVMQESAQAALSYLKSRQKIFEIPEDFFEETDIHIHVPEGAIPKDGPSAGITLATALISAALGVPIRHEVAMTGEITLRGRVLQIGGVREKVLAAHRSGIKTVILPGKNEKDLVDIPEAVLKELEIIFVDHMDQVTQASIAGELKYANGIYPVKRKPSRRPPMKEPRDNNED